ncbi:MAG: hypothetical protein DBX00_07040 [Verrucomicrobia bacterium]|nr:hypothetical protein [Roseibacillus sp.]RCL35858.1 MAG: hypothetical protein DBX00_07040 [Verrucomicrobiota bacterium]RPF86555.1 MAG: hypothetical protein CBB78_010440 [Roseibacillus sp. TMED18]
MKRNDDVALLASAVVLLAGAVSLGLGGVTQSLSKHRGLGIEDPINTVGFILLAVGGWTFLGTFLKRNRKDD